MTANAELLRETKEAMSGQWGLSIATFLVYIILVGALQAIPHIGPFIGLVIGGPFALGLIIFSRNVLHHTDPRLEQLFDGFKNWGTAIAAYLLVAVATILGFVLLIIPGIIVSLGLALTMYIVADDPEIGAYDAMSKSWDMMDGYKIKYLGLILMFLGLSLLCILTLGIGFLWLIPYSQVALVRFYEDVKADYETLNPEPLSAEGAA